MFSHTRRSRAFMMAAAVLCSILLLPGCNSIYHRTGEELSQDTPTCLDIRIREARAAAASASAVIAQCSPDSPDLRDRAESYSWEFSKAVASVHDVAARVSPQSPALCELLAALDKADKDLADAVDPDQTQSSALRPAFALAAESLKAAIARADAYAGERATLARPKQTSPA